MIWLERQKVMELKGKWVAAGVFTPSLQMKLKEHMDRGWEGSRMEECEDELAVQTLTV